MRIYYHCPFGQDFAGSGQGPDRAGQDSIGSTGNILRLILTGRAVTKRPRAGRGVDLAVTELGVIEAADE
jgi:hypothetical protein